MVFLLVPAFMLLVPATSAASRPGEAEALQALIQDARWPEADAAARALVAQRAAADGEDSPAYAAAVDFLVEVLVRSGR